MMTLRHSNVTFRRYVNIRLQYKRILVSVLLVFCPSGVAVPRWRAPLAHPPLRSGKERNVNHPPNCPNINTEMHRCPSALSWTLLSRRSCLFGEILKGGIFRVSPLASRVQQGETPGLSLYDPSAIPRMPEPPFYFTAAAPTLVRNTARHK